MPDAQATSSTGLTDPLVGMAERHDYRALFLKELRWAAPDHPPITYIDEDGANYTATNIASYQGLRVWVCPQLPGSKTEVLIDRAIAQSSTDRLVIFHDENKQVWRWPVRRIKGGSNTTRLTSHRHTTGTPNEQFAHRLTAIQLPADVSLDANTVMARVRSAFDVEAQNETKHASKLMARMYTAMEKCYPDTIDAKERDHQIAVTLARILFLMFGDDTDMWTQDLFRDFIYNNTNKDGLDTGPKLSGLFTYLDTPDKERGTPEPLYEGFPYVNGRIFQNRIALPDLNIDFREGILEACAVDWSTVSPAIFGSMFQSVRDAQTRRELGEHYTSEENILRTLKPLFLDELWADFEQAQQKKNESLALRKLRDQLGDIRYMDPACGCGNFIIVAYRELRDLELRIMERLQEVDQESKRKDATIQAFANTGLKVTLDHFYGIEIDEWPARIAETAMFLIDRQCDLKLNERLGWTPNRLPIHEQATITVANALTADWTEICPPSETVIIAGNPPFLGISLRSEAQTEDLRTVWGAGYHGTLDYVTGWHAKALDYFHKTNGRWAFVTTNSITQGEAVAPLFDPIVKSGWRILFAHRTFRWESEAVGAAAVHCVIIGFTKDSSSARLFDYTGDSPREIPDVKNINPYLTDGPTVIVRSSTHPLNPQLGTVAYGNKPTDGGHLIVEPDEYDAVAADPIAAKYVRKFIGARELLHGADRYCLWLTHANTADMQDSQVLKERIELVREFRAKSKAASTREAAVSAHLFRQLAQPDTSYLCIPRHVSENRPYFLSSRFEPDVICSDANFLAQDDDGFIFAVISSTMFITWQRTVGGRLESRLRFNKLLTWNTFPLPPVSAEQRGRIILAGEAVQVSRELQPGVALADLYTPGKMSAELLAAHDELDARVDALFETQTARPSELERQELLFTKYVQLTTAG